MNEKFLRLHVPTKLKSLKQLNINYNQSYLLQKGNKSASNHKVKTSKFDALTSLCIEETSRTRNANSISFTMC